MTWQLIALALVGLSSSGAEPQFPLHHPLAYASPYNVAGDPDCWVEQVPIENLECKPTFEIKCDDEEVRKPSTLLLTPVPVFFFVFQKPSDSIKYKRVCKTIVDTICGNSQPLQVGLGYPVSPPGASAAVPPVPAPPAAVPVAPTPYLGNCHQVPREHCYTMPFVEVEGKVVPVCHVVTKAVCEPVTTTVHRHVCRVDDEADNETEEEGGQEVEEEEAEVEARQVQYVASPAAGRFFYQLG